MRKNIFAVIALAMIALLFVACEPEKAQVEETPRNVVDVLLTTTQSKTLDSDVNKDIEYWEFMATPQFTLGADEKVYGVVSYWRMLEALDTAGGDVKTSCSLGRYTSGEWLFELRALNSEKHVVAIGSTKQVLREGADNTVNIDMYIDRTDGRKGESADADSRMTGWDGHNDGSKTSTTVSTGTLHAGLVANRMDADVTNMKVVTLYQKMKADRTYDGTVTPSINWDVRNGGTAESGGVSTGQETIDATKGAKYTNWYLYSNTDNWDEATIEVDGQQVKLTDDSTTYVEQGKVYYEATLDNLSPGSYIFTFYVQGKNKAGDWINLGGQAIDVVIIGGEETQVKGTILANEYVLAGMKITAPGTIYGSINGTNFIQGDPAQEIKLAFSQTDQESAASGEKPIRWYWYVNGDKLDTTAQNITFKCPTYDDGTYAYGIYRITCVPTGQLGSTGTITVDVIFNPDEGPNTGEFDWNSILSTT